MSAPSVLDDDDIESVDDDDDVGDGENDPCDRCDCPRYLHADSEGECSCGKCRKFKRPA